VTGGAFRTSEENARLPPCAGEDRKIGASEARKEEELLSDLLLFLTSAVHTQLSGPFRKAPDILFEQISGE
jgi:hypothetical protein